MATIKDVFQQYVKELGTDIDYIFPCSDNIRSNLLKELYGEGIPVINVNGFLLIRSNDVEKVNALSKGLLQKQQHFTKETTAREMQDTLAQAGISSINTCSIDDVSEMKYGYLADAFQGVPQAIVCVDEQEQSRNISFPKTSLFPKKGKGTAQAVLEAALRSEMTDTTTKIQDFEYNTKAQNYIEENKTAVKEYYITSEIDPSVFMTVSNNGFSLCHWQVYGGDTKKITDYQESKENPDYMKCFYKTLAKFPDVKIANSVNELTSILLRRKKPRITAASLKTRRGIKVLAKRINKMITTANNQQPILLSDYLKEAERIITAIRTKQALQEYSNEDAASLQAIVSKYGLSEGLSRVDELENGFQSQEKTIATKETQRKELERNADTNREGTH